MMLSHGLLEPSCWTSSPHLQAFVDQTLRGTHFRMDGCDFLTHTRAGVRPGDAISDILFAFVQADFLRALQESLVVFFFEDDVLQDSPLAGRPISPTWADDTVPLLSAPTCARLLVKVARLGEIMHELLHSRGLCPNCPNYGKFFWLWGAFLQAAQQLFVADGGCISSPARTGPEGVRCVSPCRHPAEVCSCFFCDSSPAVRLAVTSASFVRTLPNSCLPGGLKTGPLHSNMGFRVSESEAWRKAWTRLGRALAQTTVGQESPFCPIQPLCAKLWVCLLRAPFCVGRGCIISSGW